MATKIKKFNVNRKVVKIGSKNKPATEQDIIKNLNKLSKKDELVGVRLEKEMVNFLKQEATKQTLNNNEMGYIDLIRKLIKDYHDRISFENEIKEWRLLAQGISSQILSNSVANNISAPKFEGSFIDYYNKKHRIEKDHIDLELKTIYNTDASRAKMGCIISEVFEDVLSKFSFPRIFPIIDKLPCGQYARYDMDSNRCFMLSKCSTGPINLRRYKPSESEDYCEFISRLIVDDIHTDSREVLIPTYENSLRFSFHINDLKAGLFEKIENGIFNDILFIIVQEEIMLFKTLECAAVSSDKVITMKKSVVNKKILTDECKNISENGIVKYIVINPNNFYDICQNSKESTGLYLDNNSRYIIELAASYNHTPKIAVLNTCPKDRIFILTDNFGIMPERQSFTTLPADDPVKLEIGGVSFEEIGLCVVGERIKCIELKD